MENPTPIFAGKPAKIKLVIGILLAFLIPLVLMIGMGLLQMNYYDRLFYSRFFYWGTALLLFVYALYIERQPFLLAKATDTGVGFVLLSALILYLLSIAAAIVSAIPMLFGVHDSISMMKKVMGVLKGHPLMIFFIALTAGVTEELIFRGYLLTRLSQLFKNNSWAIIVSSLLFSSLHYKYGSYRELIFTFVIGVVFSIYYLRYRNIVPLVIAHFLIDFINMILAQHIKLK